MLSESRSRESSKLHHTAAGHHPFLSYSGNLKFKEIQQCFFPTMRQMFSHVPTVRIHTFVCRAGNTLTTDERRGMQIHKYVSLNTGTIVSTLEIKHARLSDQGVYVCRTSNKDVTSTHVNVLNGKAPFCCVCCLHEDYCLLCVFIHLQSPTIVMRQIITCYIRIVLFAVVTFPNRSCPTANFISKIILH